MTETLSAEQIWLELRKARVDNVSRGRLPGNAAVSLERALRQGLAADPDPRRAGFYEASFDGYRYYFWVSPREKVFLLARWRAA